MGISGQTIWRQTGNFLRKQKIIRKMTYYESGFTIRNQVKSRRLYFENIITQLQFYDITEFYVIFACMKQVLDVFRA